MVTYTHWTAAARVFIAVRTRITVIPGMKVSSLVHFGSFLCLLLCLCVSVSVHVSNCVFVYLCVCVSMCLSTCVLFVCKLVSYGPRKNVVHFFSCADLC